jgi:hypothetical protein
MRLVGQIHITVRGDIVLRDPSWWEKVKRGLGSRVDLETNEVKNGIEATTIVDAVRRALGRLGVGNALSLVIDDTVIFQDSEGKPDDLPDLVIALSEHASVFGRGFRELRFAAEHEEAGLRLVIETRARTRHRKDEPAAIVSVGGRLAELEPARGESAEAYRSRVDPLIKDPSRFEGARHAFESFVQRLEGALGAMLPDADVVEKKAETRLVRAPDGAVATPPQKEDRPLAPGYDPYLHYYPSPMGTMLDAMIFASVMHMMMPPPMMLVSPLGSPLGSVAEVQARPELASDEHVARADGALANDDHGGGHGGASDGDGDAGSAGEQGSGDGGAWWDDSGDSGGGGGWDDGGGGWDGGGGDGGLD